MTLQSAKGAVGLQQQRGSSHGAAWGKTRALGLVGISFIAVCLAAPAGPGLADAAKRQNKEAVRRLLASHADVNAAQDDGATALHWAAQWDDSEVADLLLRAGANANAQGALGVTPLSLACVNGSAPMVTALLAAGAKPGIATVSGETPLMGCARAGSVEAVRRLIEHGADVNVKEKTQHQTALMWAVAERHPGVIRLLIEHGADVRARTRVSSQVVVKEDSGARLVCPPPPGVNARCINTATVPMGGSTPLLFAARSGDVESARILLAAGAGVNEAAPDGNSALVVAALSGNTQTAMLLLDKDASPNAASTGYTALHIAVLREDRELTAALLKHAANPNAKVTNGMPVRRSSQDFFLPDLLIGATPFFLAAKFAEPELMRLLVAAGADIRQPIQDGTTPLMAAAGIGWKAGETRRGAAFAMVPPPDDARAMEGVRICLENGANPTAANQAGETALHGAAAEGYAAIADLLLEKGAAIDARNRRGQTPLALTSLDLLGANGSYGVRDRKSVRALLVSRGAHEAPPPPPRPPRNLQVLKDPSQVPSVMASFTAGLGVQCEFCHAPDRGSDGNPHKETARRMMNMVANINAAFSGSAVSCYTCHRGTAIPLAEPPARAAR